MILMGDCKPYKFKTPLIEGIIIDRPNRFIMHVQIFYPDSVAVVCCHCPTTGKIGSIELAGRPVLLSYHDNPKRKMAYTVEAISYNKPTDKHKTWIGINQTMANRYVEHYLRQGAFRGMLKSDNTTVEREKKLGNSRIDFKVGDTYLEVKTPVQVIEKIIPNHITIKGHGNLYGGERLVKHITELGDALATHERAIMLTTLLYIPELGDDHYDDGDGSYVDAGPIIRAINRALGQGIEEWRCWFRLTSEDATLMGYRKVNIIRR